MQAHDTLRALAELLQKMLVKAPDATAATAATPSHHATNDVAGDASKDAAKRAKHDDAGADAEMGEAPLGDAGSPNAVDGLPDAVAACKLVVVPAQAALAAPAYPAELPPVEAVFQWLALIVTKTQVSVEVAIVAVIYIRRLMATSGTKFTNRNWRSLIATGILIAGKVWDDLSMVNKDFACFLPYSVRELNRWERLFVCGVAWRLDVSTQEFACLVMDLTRPQRQPRILPRFSLRRTRSETVCD